MRPDIDVAPLPLVPLHGKPGFGFPVRRIFGVGRNYLSRATEEAAVVGAPPTPLIFQKPIDAVALHGQVASTRFDVSTVFYEAELVVLLRRGGMDLTEAEAERCLYGCAVGVDLTRHALLGQAKASGAPWASAKGFENSAVIGDVTPCDRAPTQGRLWLTVNGKPKQDADIAEMTWNVLQILQTLSRLFVLQAGDAVFTGTPGGIGPLAPGDEVCAGCSDLAPLRFSVADAVGEDPRSTSHRTAMQAERPNLW